MAFCGKCGKRASEDDKFCRNCGNPITEVTVEVAEEVGEIIKEEYKSNQSSSMDEPEEFTDFEEPISQTARQLGNNLEEAVERIFKSRGYETQLRQKLKGKSGQYNEIDVLAKRNRVTLAIECKNYAEGTKIGIDEMRNFITKLEDLDINRGLFVTSSDFSSVALEFAANNPFSKQIETWDRSTFMEQHTAVTLGRTNNKLTKVENSLALKGTFEDYSILPLKIKEKVIIKRRDLIFHPYYIISFNLNGLVKTPDKQTHSRHNSGTYYVDGLSGEILYRKDVNGNHKYDLDKEQEQAIKDLHENDPQNMIEVTQVPNSEVKKLDPSMYKKDVEFRVRRQVVNDNKDNIPYKIRRSKDIVETKYHPYVPEINSITVQSKMIYVPKMEIEFESKEYSYSRIIFPASEVWLEDEISDCKHMLGRKRPTFAVCEVCGIAKCEKDLFCDDSGQCYCKNDASEELKEAKKENSFSAKLKRFSFKK